MGTFLDMFRRTKRAPVKAPRGKAVARHMSELDRNSAIRLAETTLKQTKEQGRVGTFIADGVIDGIEYNQKLNKEAWLGQAGSVGIVQQMRLTNPQLQALGLAVKLPIIGAEWAIKPVNVDELYIHGSGPKLTQDAADEHAAMAKRALFESPTDDWRSTVRQGLLHIDFGFMLFEKVWQVADDGAYVLGRLAPRLPQTIEKWLTKDGQLSGVFQRFWDPDRNTYGDATIDAENLVLLTHNREGDNYEGVSMYRPIWAINEIKGMLLKLLGIAFEREAMGVPIGVRPDGGTTDEQDDDVEDLLKDLRGHQKAFGILPHGWSLEWYFNEGGSAAREAILSALRYLDEQTLNAGLAQFLGLGSTATGSRAVAREHIDLFFLALNGIATDMATPFNGVGRSHTSGVLRQITLLNFGEQAAYPTLVAQAIEAKNLEDFSSALQKMNQYITVDDVVEEYVRSFMGIPITPVEDRVERQPAVDPNAPPTNPDDKDADPKDDTTEEDDTDQDPSVKASQTAYRFYDQLERPLTNAEQHVRFNELIFKLDTAPADLISDMLDVARAGVLRVGNRVQKAIQDGKPDNLPKSIPGLLEALESVVLEEVRRTVEFGNATVHAEAKRQGRAARLDLVRGGPRRFADEVDDTAAALLADYEAHLEVRDLALQAQAKEVASEAYNRVLNNMRVESMGALRRAANGIDLLTTIPGPTGFKQGSAGLVATALNLGRDQAAMQLKDQVSMVEFSALMDARTCPSCTTADGAGFAQGSAEHMSHECPFGDCEGGSLCRCILVYTFKADQELDLR